MIKVYVIAPDIYSGQDFNKVLNKHNIETEFHFHKIRPRVIENKITTSNDVLDDMNSIFETFQDKTKSVVIACNTLQLWIDEIKEDYKRNIKVYTTFEACEWSFAKSKTKPLWIGTTPLTRVIKRFPTLISLKDEENQEVVQELIWRIKMYGNDDIQTAPDRVKRDFLTTKYYQKVKINKLKQDIFTCLKKHNIKHVINGCTELPLIFNKKRENGITFYNPAEILADYIKSQSVSIIFCGGTISSIANKEGMRVDGKALDLLERLSFARPGSYKKLNITKSDVVYSGFSENMTNRDRQELLRSVKKSLKIGFSRIVITHGTDSMEQTARFLQRKLASTLSRTNTVIVLTGSNDHAGSPVTDAWDNLKVAINENTKQHKSGVFVAFHNLFIPAGEVKKSFSDGVEMHYISDKSIEYRLGVKKYEKWKESKKEYIRRKYLGKIPRPIILEYKVNKTIDDHASFVKLVKRKKPDAILFTLYHSSTANVIGANASVSFLVKKLSEAGMLCFGITENGEPTDLTKYRSSVELKNAGLIGI